MKNLLYFFSLLTLTVNMAFAVETPSPQCIEAVSDFKENHFEGYLFMELDIERVLFRSVLKFDSPNSAEVEINSRINSIIERTGQQSWQRQGLDMYSDVVRFIRQVGRFATKLNYTLYPDSEQSDEDLSRALIILKRELSMIKAKLIPHFPGNIKKQLLSPEMLQGYEKIQNSCDFDLAERMLDKMRNSKEDFKTMSKDDKSFKTMMFLYNKKDTNINDRIRKFEKNVIQEYYEVDIEMLEEQVSAITKE